MDNGSLLESISHNTWQSGLHSAYFITYATATALPLAKGLHVPFRFGGNGSNNHQYDNKTLEVAVSIDFVNVALVNSIQMAKM